MWLRIIRVPLRRAAYSRVLSPHRILLEHRFILRDVNGSHPSDLPPESALHYKVLTTPERNFPFI